MNSDFTKGKILGPLFRFALPVLLALLLQVMYGAVDLIVVGKFASTADVSAVSTGSQITQTVTSVIAGLAMGITILVGQYLGEGKSDRAGSVIGSGITFFIFLGLLLSLTLPLLTDAMVRLMKAPEEAYAPTVSYVKICLAGSVFIVAFNLLGSVMRGLGDSKTPLLAVVIACVVNIGGDVLLVARFGMGSAGAACATVAAQALSVLICLAVLIRRGLPFAFSGRDLVPRAKLVFHVVKLGAPLALQDLLVSVSFLVILAIVNSLGVVVSAGVGVAEKICGFVMLIPSSMSQSLSAFVAQNYGAGEYRRAEKSLFCAIGLSFSCALFIAYAGFFHGDVLASLFANDPEVVSAAADYLKAYSVDVLLTSFMFCYSGYFNGCGRTGFNMLHGICSAFFIRIPVSWFMSRRTPVSLFHIGLATPCSTFVQCILCTVYFFWLRKKLNVRTIMNSAEADGDAKEKKSCLKV